MKVLVIGGGGREHALAWKAAQSKNVSKVFVAPGNAGTALEDKLENIAIAADDIEALKAFAQKANIDLTIVGPEAPLVEGIVDTFTTAGLRCFGPSKGAAQLEGSKSFTKDFLARHNIPTGSYGNFTEIEAAVAYIKEQGAPIVVKADGLAAGKGVTVATTEAEALAALKDIFTSPGGAVVIEEFMEGEEASFFVLSDGKTALPMGTAQDHKRAFDKNILPMASSQDHKAAHDGDTGPNTGGMGAYSPAPVMTDAVTQKAMSEIIQPTLDEMARRGMPFQGVLFAGFMIKDGQPRLVEYNVRFGDPEIQAIAMRLGGQLLDLLLASAEGTLDQASVNWAEDHALTIVMAAKGYPGAYEKGEVIRGLGERSPQVKIFHAGTVKSGDDILSNGGRVLAVTARGETLQDAHDRAYARLKRVNWPGSFSRSDIGWRSL